MSTDVWATVVTGAAGWILFAAAIVLLVMRKWRSAGYLTVTAYVMLIPIHLWFWQFELTSPQGLPRWYFSSAVIQIVGGVLAMIWFCFVRFRPIITALVLMYVFSLILQLFSYMYWSYGTVRDFNVNLSHLDSFYFALGTLTMAGTGNVSAISETARRLQTLQMGIDFILIGFVVVLILTRYSSLLDRSEPRLPQYDLVTAMTTIERILEANKPTVEPEGTAAKLSDPAPLTDGSGDQTIPGCDR